MKNLLAALCLLAAAVPAAALNSMTLSVTGALVFPSANPNTTPVIAGSAPVTATIFIVNPNRESITLTVQADGSDLISAAGNTIPVGNVAWDAVSATWVHSIPPRNTATWGADNGPKTLTTSAVTVITGNDGRANTTTDTVTGTVTHNFTFQNS
ncbi:MAG TPA: hypothetical protein VIZ69_06060, partial [Thermoanaerobaculia bacterium]